ncbi:uncharacterized protein igsf9a isoform X2 [Clupea harengus]|uniref:Uncharacterized protein igsf9a isoform X2 n=1 Tax=Clupea harengus TaxID=7950 RepID=A0A6P8GDA3_CLUHA|nr:uncharacterized protein igsf9a isoform X2 [Clupea harengus]
MGQQRLHILLLTAAAFTLWPLYLAGGAEPSVRAKEGSAAVLGCSLAPVDVGAASPRHVVEWVRQGFDIPILIKFGTYAPRVHPDYEGRVSLTGNSALSVGALRLEDQGRYECRILPLEQTDKETRNGSWTLLSVYAPPIFTETSPPVVEALLGRPITLRCVVRGNPPPRVTWAKNGVLLKQNNTEVRNGTVSFRSVTTEAAGEYKCQASNSEGNVSLVIQLKVKGPPVIRIPPKDLVLNISQKAQLQCQAEADPPNMTYVWQRQGENVHHIQSLKSRVKVLVDGTLLISRVTPEDSGNYTCTPTNGLLTPPSASAYLIVRHPAQVLQMPQETYLPTGMGGAIPCPIRAEPPLLRVDWTKDGKPLDLDTYPGWTLSAQGSVVVATANDDAAGVYTCTPYNSYGTMGQSETTRVILQDPPSFKVPPRKEYRQDVGRMLVIPCQAAGDPAPQVTWRKVGRSPSSSFTVAANGSLVLHPLSKDHQGAWECSSSNRVATVNTSTTVLVLGTSPHAVPLLSVSAALTSANVSWEPGFDGGYTQKFTIWLKRVASEADGEKQEWASVPVPPSAGTTLLVTGLLPSTDYQFSVLPQNKMGTGPFSDITSARTLDPKPVVMKLAPPTFLSANVTTGGVVMRWLAPHNQSPPIQGFVLQSRLQGGRWSNLAEGISANHTQMLVQGLRKDSVYELRLLSQRGDEQSRPSASINISTAGLEASVSPASRGMLQLVPEPLLAGVMGGLGLLCVALLLIIGVACVFRRRSAKRKRRDDLTPALLTSPCGTASAAGGSPDSVLKHKLLPPSSLSSTSSSSASSPSDPSSFEQSGQGEYQQRGQPLPRHHPVSFPESTLSRGRDGGGGPLSALSALELISRGPDGRFSLETYAEIPLSHTHTPVRRNLHTDFSGLSAGRGGIHKSHSLRSYREDRINRDAPFVVSVDLPPPEGTARVMAKHLSLQGHYLLGAQDLSPSARGLPECSSLLSEGSGLDAYSNPEPEMQQGSFGYGSVKRNSGADNRPMAASLLVLQMEHERERGNLSRCLTLAREREALERELRKYSKEEQEDDVDQEPELVWKTREGASPRDSLHASRGCSSLENSGRGNTRPSSCVLWEASPLSSPTRLVPVQKHPPPQQADGDWTGREGGQAKHSLLTAGADLTLRKQRSFRQEPELRRVCVSPERLSVAGSLRQDYQEAISAESYTGTHRRADDFPGNPDECTFVEMSVDGPEIGEQYHTASSARCVAQSDQHGGRHTHTQRGSGQTSRTLSHLDVLRPDLRKTGSLGSRRWNGFKSTQSLDYRKRGEFLTPDAWVHSISLDRASSASPFPFPHQHEDEDLSGEPYRGTPNPHLRGTPNPPSRGTPNPPVSQSSDSRRSVRSLPSDRSPQPFPVQPCGPRGGETPDPRRQASTFPQESMGDPDLPNTTQRGSPPHERRYPTPDSGNTPLNREHPPPESGNSPLDRGHCPPDRRIPPNDKGHPSANRGHPRPDVVHPPPDSCGGAYGWLPAHWASIPGREEERGRGPEEKEAESQEVDAEIRAYRSTAESEGNYRSYASQSSGRGSMEPPSSLSPPLISSPETTEESEHEEQVQWEGLKRRRTSSVDENYEWDTHYVPMKPVYVKSPQSQRSLEGENRGHSCRTAEEMTSIGGEGMFPSVRMLKSGGSFSSTGLPHHHGAEPETVLF